MVNTGERLRAERERLGMTQDSFATAGGVGKRALINYEKGERSPDATFLTAIADEGVDVLYVLTGERSGAQLAHDAAEQVLLDSYRRCKPEARQHLIQTAALLSAGLSSAPAPAKAPASQVMKNLSGGSHTMIGSVGGALHAQPALGKSPARRTKPKGT